MKRTEQVRARHDVEREGEDTFLFVEQQQQLKHLEKRHASTKLAAKVANAASETESHSSEHTTTPPKQQRLEFERETHSQAQLDKTIARHVVENMLPISTVEDPAFRQIISKVPCTVLRGASLSDSGTGTQLPLQQRH
ncbi:CKLF-like MARVEL transmembrane domain-containing protein 8b isoform X3 [Solea solea]|uniref:CKLF-like MARVEL transmembrane domain-containing protein 8b isoform X3 n=1 Tax=Solea solea TaxID=90069 RepID=UPI00272D181B|nr:CKLF-like MARVEL transmembrane domain-containing protein 8b isoform X3 [Solea solea]